MCCVSTPTTTTTTTATWWIPWIGDGGPSQTVSRICVAYPIYIYIFLYFYISGHANASYHAFHALLPKSEKTWQAYPICIPCKWLVISSYWFMKVFHDPWLRYVTLFNVVNGQRDSYRNLSAIGSSRQKPGRRLPDSAYHRLSPLSRPTSSSSTSLPSFPKCRRPTQIKPNLQSQLSVTAHVETSGRIKEFYALLSS